MKYSEEYKKDPMYWQQFDMETDALPIDKVELIRNTTEEARVKNLLKVIAGEIIEPMIPLINLDWYVIYHLLKNGCKLNLEYLETNSLDILDSITWEMEQDNGNICIIETRDDKIPDKAEMILERLGFTAIVINKELPTKFRINLINH